MSKAFVHFNFHAKKDDFKEIVEAWEKSSNKSALGRELFTLGWDVLKKKESGVIDTELHNLKNIVRNIVTAEIKNQIEMNVVNTEQLSNNTQDSYTQNIEIEKEVLSKINSMDFQF